MARFMDRIGCQAAVLAVAHNGQVIVNRGFGWQDRDRKVQTAPDALMRIAGITKPITAAAVKELIDTTWLTPDTQVFPLLAVHPPAGASVDPRLAQVTVKHLLDHRGGWDRDRSFDPMFSAARIETGLQLSHPATPADVVEFMLTQPLDFDPGARVAYSNFGYCVLGRLIEKVSGIPYTSYVRRTICDPHGIDGIALGRSRAVDRHPAEVWYPVAQTALNMEMRDSTGGLIASAPALCQFMQHYWLSGERRQPDQVQHWSYGGDFPGTMAYVIQNRDGIDIAMMLNNRRDSLQQDRQALQRMVDEALTARPNDR